MKLKITVEDQMARNPLPWFTALTFFLICLSFLGFRFSSFLLTSTLLIMSLIFFTIPKKTQLSDEKLAGEEPLSDHDISSISAPTRGLLSETECADDNFTTSEDSEVEWPFSDRTAQNPGFSDGSISDEESLIEIAIPTGHYVSNGDGDDEEEEDETTAFCLEKHRNLVEVLAEFNDINEEENLIEIDISMGSIKYSRLEIEA